jgi:hypothetical protein
MAQIRVINNHTGDEGEVDETWLERWPEDFTALSDDHTPLVEQAAQTEDPGTEIPAPDDGHDEGETPESDGQIG